MSKTRTFIVYSTVAGLFSNSLYFFYDGVMIQAFYFLLVPNLLLMLTLRKRLWVPKGLLIFLSFLVISGALGVARGTDTILRFLKDFAGISLCSFYFCCFFRAIDYNLEACFRLYARISYWIAILGLAMLPFQWHFYGYTYRLSSILLESYYFVMVCMPALFYFVDQWQRKRRYGKELLVMMVAIVVSGSSVGYLVMLLGVGLFLMRYTRARLIAPAAILVFGFSLYWLSTDFKLRIDDTLSAIRGGNVYNVNLSTLAWYSNIYVTGRVVQEHFFLGNGLNSHGLSHAKYIEGVDGIDGIIGTDYELIGAEDAQSLALRVISDMGLLGGFLVVWFMWRYRPQGDSELDVMCKAILLYFVGKLARGGHYFSPEQYFFVVFYAIHGMTEAGAKVLGARIPRESGRQSSSA